MDPSHGSVHLRFKRGPTLPSARILNIETSHWCRSWAVNSKLHLSTHPFLRSRCDSRNDCVDVALTEVDVVEPNPIAVRNPADVMTRFHVRRNFRLDTVVEVENFSPNVGGYIDGRARGLAAHHDGEKRGIWILH